MTFPTDSVSGRSRTSRPVHEAQYHTLDATWARWRTGRKIERTIYAMVGDTPSDRDELIGVMDTGWIASEAVGAHNAALDRAVAGREEPNE